MSVKLRVGDLVTYRPFGWGGITIEPDTVPDEERGSYGIVYCTQSDSADVYWNCGTRGTVHINDDNAERFGVLWSGDLDGS